LEVLSKRGDQYKSGNWNNGVHAGCRAVNLNNYPWNVNVNIGSRLACDFSLSNHGKDGGINYGFYPCGVSVKNHQIDYPPRKGKVC
jgi:hypothetical protein